MIIKLVTMWGYSDEVFYTSNCKVNWTSFDGSNLFCKGVYKFIYPTLLLILDKN